MFTWCYEGQFYWDGVLKKGEFFNESNLNVVQLKLERTQHIALIKGNSFIGKKHEHVFTLVYITPYLNKDNSINQNYQTKIESCHLKTMIYAKGIEAI